MRKLGFMLALCSLSVSAQEPIEKRMLNLNFERSIDNKIYPSDWKTYGNGHLFKMDSIEKFKGNASLLIESKENRLEKDSIAIILNSIPIGFKGKVISFSGYLKLDNIVGRAGLSLIINGESGPIAVEEMKARNLHGTKPWKKYVIRLPLSDSAKSIYYSLYQIGNGKLWADNLKLSVDDEDISNHIEKPIDSGYSNVNNDGGISKTSDFSVKFGKVIVSSAQTKDSASLVSKVPDYFQFNAFYEKYLNAAGLPIIGSARVSDQAFYKAREILLMMLRNKPLLRENLINNNVRIAIIGRNELVTDLPEYNTYDKSINMRARGFGGSLDLPLTSCAEENVLGLDEDRYNGEDILIHEFAHTIRMMALSLIDKDFNNKLKTCYANALRKGLWKNTYAISSPEEYFAEGVQSWFNVNKYVKEADGIHNEINTNDKLKSYDPLLHKLISTYFTNDQQNTSMHIKNNLNKIWMPQKVRQ